MRVFFCLKFRNPKMLLQFPGQLLDFIYRLDSGSPRMELLKPLSGIRITCFLCALMKPVATVTRTSNFSFGGMIADMTFTAFFYVRHCNLRTRL